MAVLTAIAATSYATPSAQTANGRARVAQMRREADQAESRARQLRAQADQAEQEAQQSQGKLRAVTRPAFAFTDLAPRLADKPLSSVNQGSTRGRLLDVTA